jgi:hypothetical protein
VSCEETPHMETMQGVLETSLRKAAVWEDAAAWPEN